ncbi:MAG: thioredoxin family protein, partial [Thermofilaceae archaeon]
ELRVYMCRNPEHEKLLSILDEVLSTVKGNKPKLKVVRHKLRDPNDFPSYVAQLEEIFGGIATAEFRKYGIKSLPAIVYKGKAILQGKVPTKEELEEALAYEGIKVTRREPKPAPTARQHGRVQLTITVPSLQAQQRLSKQADGLQRKEEAKTGALIELTEHVLPGKSEQAGKPAPLPTTPANSPAEASGEARTLSKTPNIAQPPLDVEELKLEKATQTRSPQVQVKQVQSTLRKTCGNCIFYSEIDNRCVLYRVTVRDPSRPICR